MADRTDTVGEGGGQGNNTNVTNQNTSSNIDALSQASAPPGNGITSGMTHLQASSITFIISILSYLWYIVPLILMCIGEIFTQNIDKALWESYDSDYGDLWDKKDQKRYETYMSYLVPFLIAGIFFIIGSVIQLFMWFALSFVKTFFLFLYFFTFCHIMQNK